MKKAFVATFAAFAIAGSVALHAQQPPALTRTTLQQVDLSIPGREVVTVRAEFPAAGSTSGRHTHPGDEVTYVLEGTLTLEVEGAAAKTVKAGEAFVVPAGRVHNATAQGGKVVAIANYLIEKGKPVTTPVAAAKPVAAIQKTPWGDPDIAGVWTSDAAIGIPMQRPDRFNGRAELTDEEFRDKEQRDAQTRTRAENAIGSFRNDNAWLAKSYRQTSLIIEPPDGKMPAVTADAEKRRASRDQGTFGAGPFDKAEDFTMYDRCITRGIVGSVLPVVYGNGNRIIQAPGQVIISYEMVHDTRVIYTDGRPHLGKGIRQLLGDSRGHWEGNTLVVETTNLTDKTSIGLNGNGLRHSADMVMTERITRVGPDELRYEVRINDPKTYAAPFTISLPLVSPPGYQLLPYECLEGDYAVPNALSAERAEDKALADDAKKGIVRPRKSITQDNVNAPRPVE